MSQGTARSTPEIPCLWSYSPYDLWYYRPPLGCVVAERPSDVGHTNVRGPISPAGTSRPAQEAMRERDVARKRLPRRAAGSAGGELRPGRCVNGRPHNIWRTVPLP